MDIDFIHNNWNLQISCCEFVQLRPTSIQYTILMNILKRKHLYVQASDHAVKLSGLFSLNVEVKALDQMPCPLIKSQDCRFINATKLRPVTNPLKDTMINMNLPRATEFVKSFKRHDLRKISYSTETTTALVSLQKRFASGSPLSKKSIKHKL